MLSWCVHLCIILFPNINAITRVIQCILKLKVSHQMTALASVLHVVIQGTRMDTGFITVCILFSILICNSLQYCNVHYVLLYSDQFCTGEIHDDDFVVCEKISGQ